MPLVILVNWFMIKVAGWANLPAVIVKTNVLNYTSVTDKTFRIRDFSRAKFKRVLVQQALI